MGINLNARRLIPLLWRLLPSILEGCMEDVAYLVGLVLPDSPLQTLLLLGGVAIMVQISLLFYPNVKDKNVAAEQTGSECRSHREGYM